MPGDTLLVFQALFMLVFLIVPGKPRFNLLETHIYTFYQHLDRASKSGGDLVPFIEYATHGFVDQLKEQIDIIRDQQ